MKMLSKRAMTLIALVLAAATFATAATGFAGEKKKRLHAAEHAIESVNTVSQLQLRNKMRNIQINDIQHTPSTPTIMLRGKKK
jgi:uncharacterized protein YycO